MQRVPTTTATASIQPSLMLIQKLELCVALVQVAVGLFEVVGDAMSGLFFQRQGGQRAAGRTSRTLPSTALGGGAGSLNDDPYVHIRSLGHSLPI